ncbi:VOC family protein [Paractinoplanes abujensis]|uniref:Putative glyoxalase superfamily protein PhnB n=1 Tax=Paractinoplanes abujensis TaxID=882441 RepID=A0A7W7G3X9_9ACTN|nr:VOC family protein [Actinoplanes abujensis]MBB4695079.1 putative glyoxalase superfamily protein PhnB [Actinoplanes abujensis]
MAAKGAERFLAFVETTFATAPAQRVFNPDGTIGHSEITIGNSVVMAFDAAPHWPDMPALLCVYVDDADATFARAIAAGAEVVTPIFTSRIVGDRAGRLRDPLGNLWWVQTHLAQPDLGAFEDPEELRIMQEAQRSFADEMDRRANV